MVRRGTTVWVEVDTVLVVGPEPGPGNSDGGPVEAVITTERPSPAVYKLTVPIPIELQTSAEPGAGDSDGGGFEP